MGMEDFNIVDELEKSKTADLIKQAKQRNKKGLINLSDEEKKRIGLYIQTLYQDAKEYHDKVCQKIDKYDDVYRMKRLAISGQDEDTPNYRSPLSTVMVETIHAATQNVFFTPSDIMRVVPTEKDDIPKIEKLDTFGNWSMVNEMDVFAGCDRLFHSSAKNGNCPYMVDWVKEYGTIIKKVQVPNPINPAEPWLDDDGNQIIVDQEEEKLLYDGPRLTVFSRKDYILPKSAKSDCLPPWEMVRIPLTINDINKRVADGRFYDGTFESIYQAAPLTEQANENSSMLDSDDQSVPLPPTGMMYAKFFGRLRVQAVRKGLENDVESLDELEDEFIGTVELATGTLCELRKNNLPYKMRPTGLDGFIPDDEGRIDDIGVIEFMDGLQNGYDLLFNQYLFGTVQSNNPFGFFAPTANMKNEPIKVKAGYLFPSSDPSKVNIIKLPPPDDSLRQMMEEFRNFAQLLFGISDYSAGLESSIDPTAPAKKAEIVVAQGNVRMGLIIRRKNKTLKDIFKKWFLLYQANMPKDKFMRITGAGKNKWDFTKLDMSDFALSGIPDFELTGNIMTSNKQLQAQKAVAIYDKLSQNFLFSPQTRQGLGAYYALTKWFIGELDAIGVSDFLPKVATASSHTPEEENSMMIYGDEVEPEELDDHPAHMRIHDEVIYDGRANDEIKKRVIEHRVKHTNMYKDIVMKQLISQRAGIGQENQGVPMPQGGQPVPSKNPETAGMA